MSKFCFKNQSSLCAHYISLVAAGTMPVARENTLAWLLRCP